MSYYQRPPGAQIPPPVRAPNQHSAIVDGSPLAIVGIFVAVLRERFAPGNGPSHYPWYPDPNKTGLLIESAFEDNSIPRGKKAALYVDKDESIYGKSIIGDRAGHCWTDGKDAQWCLSTVPINIDCVAGRKGESAIVGDIVQWSLHASSDAIQGHFALHDMTPPTLGRTVPYEDDDESWNTPVAFQVQYNVRWTTVPIAPLLQEITLHIQKSGLSPSAYLYEMATRSSGRLP